MTAKYEPPLPPTIEQANQMIEERETWARHAVANDMYGSAREWQLTALLLKYYVESEHRKAT